MTRQKLIDNVGFPLTKLKLSAFASEECLPEAAAAECAPTSAAHALVMQCCVERPHGPSVLWWCCCVYWPVLVACIGVQLRRALFHSSVCLTLNPAQQVISQ